MKERKNEQRKTLLAGGICCGICLTIGSMAQQIGLQYTTAGKGGFITALYILIVPLLGLAFGRKAGKKFGAVLFWLWLECISFA